MYLTSFAVFVHAFFPFMFKDVGSSLAKSICEDIDKRNG